MLTRYQVRRLNCNHLHLKDHSHKALSVLLDKEIKGTISTPEVFILKLYLKSTKITIFFFKKISIFNLS